MTPKRRRPTDQRAARASVEAARQAAREAAESDPTGPDVDPASALFFEYAAPLLMTARNQEEFETASALADFIWATTHFDAVTQVTLLNDFIEQTNVPEAMIPWLLDVYAELAARKEALVG